jgi:hypothetical protein
MGLGIWSFSVRFRSFRNDSDCPNVFTGGRSDRLRACQLLWSFTLSVIVRPFSAADSPHMAKQLVNGIVTFGTKTFGGDERCHASCRIYRFGHGL